MTVLVRIVRDLLEFTKSNSEKSFSEVDIAEVLNGIIRLNQKAFESENITIETEILDSKIIQANRDQMEQVFMNMMLNARAATDDGGTLTVRLWDEDDDVKIQFQDNGSGIDDDLINKIFDPFISTKPDGSGLGLFVSYGIIERHHGKIEVKSKCERGNHVHTNTADHANRIKAVLVYCLPATLEIFQCDCAIVKILQGIDRNSNGTECCFTFTIKQCNPHSIYRCINTIGSSRESL